MSNCFSFLEQELAANAAIAETLVNSAPHLAAVQCRSIIERLVKDICAAKGVDVGGDTEGFLSRAIYNLNKQRIIPAHLHGPLLQIKDAGNDGAHGNAVSSASANIALDNLEKFGRWYKSQGFRSTREDSYVPYRWQTPALVACAIFVICIAFNGLRQPPHRSTVIQNIFIGRQLVDGKVQGQANMFEAPAPLIVAQAQYENAFVGQANVQLILASNDERFPCSPIPVQFENGFVTCQWRNVQAGQYRIIADVGTATSSRTFSVTAPIIQSTAPAPPPGTSPPLAPPLRITPDIAILQLGTSLSPDGDLTPIDADFVDPSIPTVAGKAVVGNIPPGTNLKLTMSGNGRASTCSNVSGPNLAWMGCKWHGFQTGLYTVRLTANDVVIAEKQLKIGTQGQEGLASLTFTNVRLYVPTSLAGPMTQIISNFSGPISSLHLKAHFAGATNERVEALIVTPSGPNLCSTTILQGFGEYTCDWNSPFHEDGQYALEIFANGKSLYKTTFEIANSNPYPVPQNIDAPDYYIGAGGRFPGR